MPTKPAQAKVEPKVRPKGAAKTGRPKAPPISERGEAPPPPGPTYDAAVADAIVRRLAEGEFLRAICRDPGMPNWATVYAWIEGDEAFAQRVARARRSGFDAIAEDSLLMLDERPARVMTQFGDKVDAGQVAWMKNRAEQRLKLLAKWAPTVYGDSVSIRHSGSVQVGLEMDADQAARVAQAILAGIQPEGPQE